MHPLYKFLYFIHAVVFMLSELAEYLNIVGKLFKIQKLAENYEIENFYKQFAEYSASAAFDGLVVNRKICQ